MPHWLVSLQTGLCVVPDLPCTNMSLIVLPVQKSWLQAGLCCFYASATLNVGICECSTGKSFRKACKNCYFCTGDKQREIYPIPCNKNVNSKSCLYEILRSHTQSNHLGGYHCAVSGTGFRVNRTFVSPFRIWIWNCSPSRPQGNQNKMCSLHCLLYLCLYLTPGWPV